MHPVYREAPRCGVMVHGATPATVPTYGLHAPRLARHAAGLTEPGARAEFASPAAEWGRLAVLASWQARVALT